MKQFLLCLFVATFSFAGFVQDADARRFGGGGSFGMKRQINPPKPQQNNINRPANTPAGAQQRAPGRSWMGPIAGIAAGLGLAALFSHLGLGAGMANLVTLLLLAAAVFFVLRFILRRAQPAQNRPMQYAGSTNANGSPGYSFNPQPVVGADMSQGAAQTGNSLTATFDEDSFVRQAKLNFIRLQAAYDEANLEDIRSFTTPEVFAEIKMQIAERGNTENHTDVIDLQAQVIEVTEETGQYIVTVRFNGMIREQKDQPPQAFDEFWHLTKPVAGDGGWMIAGIQQAA